MADKYSTIQQHQPLRVPASFDRQGRALIVQLDEIFDDIYRRFGRLRVEDLGTKLKDLCLLKDEDGNYTSINAGIGTIQLEIGGIDGVMSSLGMTQEGIDIVGNKHVTISSGGTFEVDSQNFKVDSANKKLVSGNWTLDDYGLNYKNGSVYASLTQNNGDIQISGGLDDPHFPSPGSGYNVNFVGGVGQYTPGIGLEGTVKCSFVGQDTDMIKEVWATYVCTPNPIQQSSRKVKHDINDMPAMGEKLDQLQPVTFRYNNDPDKLRYGLVYEDTLPVMPEICVEGNDVGSINYTELVPMLLKEVQILRKRVAELEAKVNVQD